MATHSSILVGRIPWTEEPGGLQSRVLQRVRHDWAHTITYIATGGRDDCEEGSSVDATHSHLKQIELRSRQWEYHILAVRQGPGSLALQKRISTKTESNETSKVFIRRKKEYSICGYSHGWTQRDTTCGSLNHLYGPFLLDFLWPIILTCPVQSPYLVSLRILPHVYMHFLGKMDSTEEAYG